MEALGTTKDALEVQAEPVLPRLGSPIVELDGVSLELG